MQQLRQFGMVTFRDMTFYEDFYGHAVFPHRYSFKKLGSPDERCPPFEHMKHRLLGGTVTSPPATPIRTPRLDIVTTHPHRPEAATAVSHHTSGGQDATSRVTGSAWLFEPEPTKGLAQWHTEPTPAWRADAPTNPRPCASRAPALPETPPFASFRLRTDQLNFYTGSHLDSQGNGNYQFRPRRATKNFVVRQRLHLAGSVTKLLIKTNLAMAARIEDTQLLC